MCKVCLSGIFDPITVKPTKWPDENSPFDKINHDLLFLQKKKKHLILTEAYSKWPEAYKMIKMDTFTQIFKTKRYFC